MKNVYFVRHGESTHNVEDKYQSDDVPLSEKGLTQAEALADRFSRIDVDVIISSDMKRARQTAEAIGEKTNKKVISSELFREKKHPSEFIDKTSDDPEIKGVREAIAKHYEDRDWHYSDEENNFDIQKRSVTSLRFIEERKEKNIVIVTHGTYLRMLIVTMMFGDTAPISDFGIFFKFVATRNTGITWCLLEDDGRWRMLTWNDHAHLG